MGRHWASVSGVAVEAAAAEAWHRRAIAVAPTQSVARNNLGTLYMQRRQWRNALEQFSAAVAAAPDNYDGGDQPRRRDDLESGAAVTRFA